MVVQLTRRLGNLASELLRLRWFAYGALLGAVDGITITVLAEEFNRVEAVAQTSGE